MVTPKSQILRNLISHTGILVPVDQSASILNLTPKQAAQTLARWAAQGWIIRIRRGLYMATPLDAPSPEQTLEDPWILVPQIFSPAYIGGWSAAEYWDFTEQIFNDICVLTLKKGMGKTQNIHHLPFTITHIPSNLFFGTTTLWFQDKQVMISDPHKTILDMLYDLKLGGGAIHTIQCVKAYMKSKHYNLGTLLHYTTQLQSGAIFKRLGYLAENILGEQDPLTLFCHSQISKGFIQFDPNFKGSLRIQKWKLIAPEDLFS